jgi:hypothetical protein
VFAVILPQLAKDVQNDLRSVSMSGLAMMRQLSDVACAEIPIELLATLDWIDSLYAPAHPRRI